MAESPVTGIPVPDPITCHHHVFSLALPLRKEFSGAMGGWRVPPLGCWS